MKIKNKVLTLTRSRISIDFLLKLNKNSFYFFIEIMILKIQWNKKHLNQDLRSLDSNT